MTPYAASAFYARLLRSQVRLPITGEVALAIAVVQQAVIDRLTEPSPGEAVNVRRRRAIAKADAADFFSRLDRLGDWLEPIGISPLWAQSQYRLLLSAWKSGLLEKNP